MIAVSDQRFLFFLSQKIKSKCQTRSNHESMKEGQSMMRAYAFDIYTLEFVTVCGWNWECSACKWESFNILEYLLLIILDY